MTLPLVRPIAYPAELARRIWRSVFPDPLVPANDRARRLVVVETLVLHFRPVQVPAAALRFTHTFGLGGSAFVLVLLLASTGLLSLFVYEPSPERAWVSVATLQQDYLFGRLVRALHHWSSYAFVAVVALHLLRVFFTGAFRAPRQFNWLVGCALLALVLAASFTGYLLPWDQRAYWAVTVSTGLLAYVPFVGQGLREALLGGDDVSGRTLRIFHALHTTVLPALLAATLALHFWRVRRAGGVVVPPARATEPQQVLFVPHLLLREVALALALLASLLWFSALREAPLGEVANPGMSPNPAQAPWYFAGFQELLLHLHPLFAVTVVPGLAALALVMLPYLRDAGAPSGEWFLSPRGRRSAGLAAALGAGTTLAWVFADARASHALSAAWPGVVATGVLPTLVIAGGLALFWRWLGRHFGATRAECVQALFAWGFAAFVVLTVVGAWCRGAGMRLVWPWQA